MKESGNDYTLSWQAVDGEVAASGEMGWTWGESQTAVKDSTGQTRIFYGKYLNVWKKQADGSWKVRVDIGNASPPKGR